MPNKNKLRVIYHILRREWYDARAEHFSLIDPSIRYQSYFKNATKQDLLTMTTEAFVPPDEQWDIEEISGYLTDGSAYWVFDSYTCSSSDEIKQYLKTSLSTWNSTPAKFYSHAEPHQTNKGHKKKLSSQGNSTPVKHILSATSSPISCVINNTMCNTQHIIPPHPILDSGANSSCIKNIDLLMPNTLYIPISTSLGVVTLSDSTTTAPIIGTGSLKCFPQIIANYVPTLGENLISISDIVDTKHIVLFDDTNGYCINLNSDISSKYNDLINFAKSNNHVSLISTRACDNLFRVDDSSLNCPLPDSTGPAAPAVTHNLTTPLVGTTSRDIVLYYHRLWNHASKSEMLLNLQYQVYPNLPRLLTPEAIRKYFPSTCIACSIGSMKVKPHPKTSTPRNILPGAEVQLDVQTWFSRGNTKSKRTVAINMLLLSSILLRILPGYLGYLI